MLGLMGFPGSLPMCVTIIDIICIFINWANKDACWLAIGTPSTAFIRITGLDRTYHALMLIGYLFKFSVWFRVALPSWIRVSFYCTLNIHSIVFYDLCLGYMCIISPAVIL